MNIWVGIITVLRSSNSYHYEMSSIITSDKGGGMRLPAMFVCLSVCLSDSKITQKTRAWISMKYCVSGHGRTDQLLSPIRIIVRMPEPENLKVEDLSKSVKQASHSEQATGHGMHCREILFTLHCSPRARKLHGSG